MHNQTQKSWATGTTPGRTSNSALTQDLAARSQYKWTHSRAQPTTVPLIHGYESTRQYTIKQAIDTTTHPPSADIRLGERERHGSQAHRVRARRGPWRRSERRRALRAEAASSPAASLGSLRRSRRSEREGARVVLSSHREKKELPRARGPEGSRRTAQHVVIADVRVSVDGERRQRAQARSHRARKPRLHAGKNCPRGLW